MKKLLLALMLAACAASAPGYAADKPASEDSIRKLLEVTESRKMLDNMWEYVDGMMETTLRQSMGDRKVSAEQQKIIDDMRVRMMAIFKEEMSWEFMEAFMIDVYTKSFTQDEVDGMLAFYATPAGRSLITKMPAVMQHSMQAMQERMAKVIPRLQELTKETVAQVQAAN